MKYYIIAGEASGDLYGSRLIDEIKSIDKKANIRFWGGDKMILSGGFNVKHIKELAFMGFYEVLKNILTIWKNINFCKKDISEFNPDRIIYIDYPGFNLVISKWAKKKGFKNYYYISPQIWAWKENRIKTIKNSIDKLYVIFPFEKEYYKDQHNMRSEFFGHPLIEQIDNFKPNTEFYSNNKISNEREIIALLPGSRTQEINTMLPIFLKLKKHFLKYQFIIAGVKSVEKNVYKVAEEKSINVIYNQTYDLLSNSKAAIVTSGTASLECALFKVPQIVCYKTSLMSYLIGKTFVKIDFISLVNIILKKEVVEELIQSQLTENKLHKELNKIISGQRRSRMLDNYSNLHSILSLDKTSNNIANSIIES
ncbi:MAG: lipid-A-disaccharide synthase [Cryomorphaceae bacterium]|jgi:lipid-A-disaccharide synthase|nr:lipid-A-disaccharide synthase [Cryomorphaceae bacterium]MDG1889025.1 lipid-A-disaccharide synthase [Flavobacteriaceae bacterium]MBT3504088.1 lipid-A-disaccharide synthase [Cryomorphaceae bacterium]MBT3688544.1 lipid-A-disaccharide synthase [Cryomorphaceae bacterium]MBT4222411.1 lipid-A-disaccharide synthase [Cryomorphaceae bacterium]